MNKYYNFARRNSHHKDNTTFTTKGNLHNRKKGKFIDKSDSHIIQRKNF